MSSSESQTCFTFNLHSSAFWIKPKHTTPTPPPQPRSARTIAITIVITALVLLVLTLAIVFTAVAVSNNALQDGDLALLPSPDALPPLPPIQTPTPPNPSTVPTPSLAPSQSSQTSAPTFPPKLTQPALAFQDVTVSLGIVQQQAEQFGGATVADLDADGLYDLILTYHNSEPMRIYFGTPEGKFVPSLFNLRSDIHGVAVAPRTASSPDRIVAISVGGGLGVNLRVPFMFLASPNRTFLDISHTLGLGEVPTRGRVPLFLNLASPSSGASNQNGGGPDILFINLLGNAQHLSQFAYENIHGYFQLRSVPGFSYANEERAIVTDIDNDGVMEVVQFSSLAIFRVEAPFQFKDVTRDVYPGFDERDLRRSISAIVELDFNNDGYWDLYIARAKPTLITPRGPPSSPDWDDVLLMNEDGVKYKDVTEAAGIPRGSDSMGVSTGDFNNDGWMDIIIATYEGADMVLINKGDGTFNVTDPKTYKPSTTRGSSMLGVDYDLDGRMDYITGHGWKKSYLGNFRVMKNAMSMGSGTHYLLVRVGNEETGACTALNAVVRVVTAEGRLMVRRVGGNGAQAGGLSFLDTVHFGIGSETIVTSVEVAWTSGMRQLKREVHADEMVSFGAFP